MAGPLNRANSTLDDVLYGEKPTATSQTVVYTDPDEYREAVREYNDGQQILDLERDARFLLLRQKIAQEAKRLDDQWLNFRGNAQQREELYQKRLNALAPLQMLNFIFNEYRSFPRPIWVGQVDQQ